MVLYNMRNNYNMAISAMAIMFLLVVEFNMLNSPTFLFLLCWAKVFTAWAILCYKLSNIWSLWPVLVLNEVDKLSREAQHSLRRTMEKYSASCRLILCCNSSSKVTEAVRSRCLNVRVSAPSEEQVSTNFVGRFMPFLNLLCIYLVDCLMLLNTACVNVQLPCWSN